MPVPCKVMKRFHILPLARILSHCCGCAAFAPFSVRITKQLSSHAPQANCQSNTLYGTVEVREKKAVELQL